MSKSGRRGREYPEFAEIELTSGRHNYFPDYARDVLMLQTKAGLLVPFELNRSQWFRENMLQEMETWCSVCEISAQDDQSPPRPLPACPKCGTSNEYCGRCDVPFEYSRESGGMQCPICRQKGLGLPVRVVEVKSRRMGASAHYQGRQNHKACTNRNHGAIIASHRKKSANAIRRKCKTFFVNMPDGLRPMTKYNNEGVLDFRAPQGSTGLGSWQQVFVASEPEDARGDTVRDMHCSEAAFYGATGPAFMQASLPLVAKLPGTTVAIETTPNGPGDYVHTRYLSARVWWRDEHGDPKPPPWMPLKAKNPGDLNSEWFAIFVPFFLNDGYRLPLAMPEEEFRSSLDDEERWLLDSFEEFGCTLETLQWRRATIVDEAGGDLAKFHQEYPATDEQAFATTGTMAFSPEKLEAHDLAHACHCEVCIPADRIAAPPENNDCPEHLWFDIVDQFASDRRGVRTFRQYQPQLIEAEPGVGSLSVWSKPQPGVRYVVWADVAKGVATGDWCDASVFREDTVEQVAHLRGKWELHNFADLLICLGLIYNTARVAPEMNGIGEGVAVLMKQALYPKMYRRRQDTAAITRQSVTMGWYTTESRKGTMVASTNRLLEQDLGAIRSRVAIDEMHIFRKQISANESGSANRVSFSAPTGANDDACMSTMGCITLCLERSASKLREASDRQDPVSEQLDILLGPVPGRQGRGKGRRRRSTGDRLAKMLNRYH